LEHVRELGFTIHRWLHKQERSMSVMARITSLNDHFLEVEALTQANFIARLKQEQNALRKVVIRIHTIRETDFISSGYFIASSTTVLLLAGLACARIEPFHESLFFVVLIGYLLLFLMFLIRDLDNPFGYYQGESSEDVSLKPLEDALADLQERVACERGRAFRRLESPNGG
jgi:predicted membrane chloride channel (bestrophin family)